MAKDPEPKKSDLLAARIPHATKRAFLKACESEGRSASEVLRDFIEGYIRRAEARARLRDMKPDRSLAMIIRSPKARIAAAASAIAGAVAIGMLTAGPSAAEVDLHDAFDALDVDGDGRVTLEEFAGSRSPVVIAVVFVAGYAGETGAHVPTDDEEYWFPISEMEDPYEMLSAEPSDRQAGADLPQFDPASEPRIYAVRTHQFGGFDEDGDGSVSFAEYQSRHVDRIAATFERFDVDRDGRLTGAEFEPIPARIAPPGMPPIELPVFQREGFEATDRDDDGLLTLAEFQAGPAVR